MEMESGNPSRVRSRNQSRRGGLYASPATRARLGAGSAGQKDVPAGQFWELRRKAAYQLLPPVSLKIRDVVPSLKTSVINTLVSPAMGEVPEKNGDSPSRPRQGFPGLATQVRFGNRARPWLSRNDHPSAMSWTRSGYPSPLMSPT